MRECCGGGRSASVPAFLIPSKVMGQYETPKERRHSAPLKRPPGLFPLAQAGTYGRPPQQRPPAPPAPPAPPPHVRRSPSPKTYSAYSVSSSCSVHGPALADNLPRHRRRSLAQDYTPQPHAVRDEERPLSWVEGLRRPSVSSLSSLSTLSARPRTSSLSPERLRRATPSPSFPSRPSSRRSVGSESQGSSHSSLEPIAYFSRQVVSPRPDIYRLLCSDLREALREEEEGEVEAEEEEERRREEEQVDSMGILGLSNKLYRETRRKQETFLAENSFLDRSMDSSQAI